MELIMKLESNVAIMFVNNKLTLTLTEHVIASIYDEATYAGIYVG